MLANYFKVAIRNLLRHKFFSVINIFGLAVAMSVGIIIIMLVADQLTYDAYNTKQDKIYRVISTRINSDGSPGQKNASSSMALRKELLERYTGIDQVVRFRSGFGNDWLELENQDVNIPIAGFYADPEVFEFFEYELELGNAATALKQPYSVVLTRKAADKLFKENNPIGLTLKVGDAGVFTVTGILKETNHKSHIVFEALASMSTIEDLSGVYSKEFRDFTDNFNHWTYILPAAGTTPSTIQMHLDSIYQQHVAGVTNEKVQKMKYALQAMRDIPLGPFINNSIGPILPGVFVYFLGGLALIILITSCFNFTNLSIARSLTRAREIGVRKVVGASKWQIFSQFLLESIITALLALILSLSFLVLLKRSLLQLNFARIFHWDLESNTSVYAIFLLFAIVVGLLAGIFPAVVLSGFKPVKVLKSLSNMKIVFRVGIRKILLIAQFTVSLFFILSVIVVHNQLKLFTTKEHGFNMETNIMVKLSNTSPGVLKTELLKHSNITSVTAASHLAASGTGLIAGFKKNMHDPEWTVLNHFSVDEDYLENMELKLVAGRFFTAGATGTNQKYVVINEEALQILQYPSAADAIGQQIISQTDSTTKTIIGVVQNYNHRTLAQTISPLAITYDPHQFSILQVGYTGSYEKAAKSVDQAWFAVNPNLKANYKEIKTEINRFYDIIFGDIMSILVFISILAICISCLGLLGIAAYTTETRMREISIRKVLGSSRGSLLLLLSKGFLGVLAIAVVIGVPLSYFVNSLWLEMIAYRTNVSLLVIGQGIFFLLLISLLTIASQTVRATRANPLKHLKNE